MDHKQWTGVHPLSGDDGPPTKRREAPPRRAASAVAEILCVLLIVLLVGAIVYGVQQRKKTIDLQATLDAATSTVVYEPLSKAGDGSYKDQGPAAKSKAVLSRLSKWKDRR